MGGGARFKANNNNKMIKLQRKRLGLSWNLQKGETKRRGKEGRGYAFC